MRRRRNATFANKLCENRRKTNKTIITITMNQLESTSIIINCIHSHIHTAKLNAFIRIIKTNEKKTTKALKKRFVKLHIIHKSAIYNNVALLYNNCG